VILQPFLDFAESLTLALRSYTAVVVNGTEWLL